MTEYARIVGGKVVETRTFDTPPDPNPAKGLDWRPMVRDKVPKHDPMSEVRERTTVVRADRIEDTWTVRSMTAQEKAKADADLAESVAAQLGREPFATIMKRLDAIEAALPAPARSR